MGLKELKRVRDWVNDHERDLAQTHAVDIFERILLACPLGQLFRVSSMFLAYPHGTSLENERNYFLGNIDALLFDIEAEIHVFCAILVLAKLPGRYRDIFRLVYKEYLPRFTT